MAVLRQLYLVLLASTLALLTIQCVPIAEAVLASEYPYTVSQPDSMKITVRPRSRVLR